MPQSRKKKPDAKRAEPDDFVSVARRPGADEDKARFEKKLGKIARAKVPAEKKAAN